ncbi:MAG: DMT family transporter [Rhizobiaceae bacterium]|nr:DMT family transporter [Rhizobiaceae bacterium]
MHRTAYILLLLAALFWGGNAVAGKLAVGHISPAVLTTFRWALSVAILVPLGWNQLVHDWPAIRPKLPLMLALGAVGFTLFNVTFYVAVSHTSVINVSIEQAGIPMVIFLLNFLLYRQRAAPLQLVGFALSLAGVAITASHGDFARLLALEVNRGDALMLLAVAAYAGYSVALRGKPNIHWMSTMNVLCLAAFATSVPFLLVEQASGHAVWPDARGWAIVAYTVLLPSIACQAFYIRGVELIGANRAGIFVNLVPVFGTVLSILLLGEAFEAYHAVAVVLVFGGIWLAELGGRRTGAAER